MVVAPDGCVVVAPDGCVVVAPGGCVVVAPGVIITLEMYGQFTTSTTFLVPNNAVVEKENVKTSTEDSLTMKTLSEDGPVKYTATSPATCRLVPSWSS